MPGSLGSEAGEVLSIPTGRCGHRLDRSAPDDFEPEMAYTFFVPLGNSRNSGSGYIL